MSPTAGDRQSKTQESRPHVLMQDRDHTYDVVVVGSGAAGLCAAIAARANGLQPVVLEKRRLIGGSTFLAGGGIWVPNNRFMRSRNEDDSFESALAYMEGLIGDEAPASSRARKIAFLEGVLRMHDFLESQGLRFRQTPGYPDYFPNLNGASVTGRGIESVIWNTRQLPCEWRARLPQRTFPRNLPMGTLDVAQVLLAKRTLKGLRRLGRIYAHHYWSRLAGQTLVGGGGALASQLLYRCLQLDIPVLPETKVVDLVVESGRVVGVVAERDGSEVRIDGTRAVFLGAGGFARNSTMREKYGRLPITGGWTSAQPEDLGDGINLGISAGAATQLMDEAWWGPSSVLPPNGPAVFHVSERSKPGSLIIDQSGVRYFNEATDYVLAGQTMYDRHTQVPAIPSFLVFDRTYRNRYPFGPNLPGRTPKTLVDNGYFKRADTLDGVARLCGIPADALKATVARFNAFARSGVDEDFHRGENVYDLYYGDPRVRPNPCLGQIAKPPFYAVALYPGDLGTKGGLVTDSDSRVLREDGTPIQGLYASGNTTASVMGRCYPGPGVTLAPALTFALLAMEHAAASRA